MARFSLASPTFRRSTHERSVDGGEVALELLEDAVALEIELELGEDEIARVPEALEERPVHGKDDALALACDVAACGQVDEDGQCRRLGVNRVEQCRDPGRVHPLREALRGRPPENRRVREQVTEHLREATTCRNRRSR